jgi:hypothetical protein
MQLHDARTLAESGVNGHLALAIMHSETAQQRYSVRATTSNNEELEIYNSTGGWTHNM